jgi:hypothetical protein
MHERNGNGKKQKKCLQFSLLFVKRISQKVECMPIPRHKKTRGKAAAGYEDT